MADFLTNSEIKSLFSQERKLTKFITSLFFNFKDQIQYFMTNARIKILLKDNILFLYIQ